MGTYEHRRIDTLTVTVHTSPCSRAYRAAATSSIQTMTVGTGITPVHERLRVPTFLSIRYADRDARGLYRRSGISPCPEDAY